MTSIHTVFENVNGASFVGIDTEVVVTLKGGKSNSQQGRVTKVVTGSSVMVFQNNKQNGYANMVKRRLENEGKNPESFQLSERRWGEREAGTPFVTHKGATYLEVIFLKAGKVTYLLDGKVINKDDVVGLPEKKAASGQGGLDTIVIIRTFKLASVTAIRIDAQEFKAPFTA